MPQPHTGILPMNQARVIGVLTLGYMLPTKAAINASIHRSARFIPHFLSLTTQTKNGLFSCQPDTFIFSSRIQSISSTRNLKGYQITEIICRINSLIKFNLNGRYILKYTKAYCKFRSHAFRLIPYDLMRIKSMHHIKNQTYVIFV